MSWKSLLNPWVLMFAPLALVMAIGGWYHYLDEHVPDVLNPYVGFLLAVSLYGYTKLSREKGSIGAASSRIYRHRNPGAFQFVLYIFYFLIGLAVLLALYSFFT